MNKQSLWFITLFSLILVLSVYYITMPSEILVSSMSSDEDKKNLTVTSTVEESDILLALRVAKEEETLSKKEDLEKVLTNNEATVDEKNNAYEQLKAITINQGTEEKLESKIREKFGKNCYIKIDNNQIRVVVASEEHSNTLANEIMKSVQEEFSDKMYISVKFQS